VVAQEHTISFQEKELTIVFTDNALYISLPSLCAIGNLDTGAQIRRIKRNADLTPGLRVIRMETRGGRQPVTCLRLAQVEQWLEGIQTGSVTGGVQANIIAMRSELPITLQALHHTANMPAEAAAFPLDDQNNTLAPRTSSMLSAPSSPRSKEEVEEFRALLALTEQDVPAESLIVTSYQEDRAIREATLARETQWTEEPGSKALSYTASNKLQVFLGNPDDPLEIPEALSRIRQLGESTALTARIILGLWNIRRQDSHLSKNGNVPIRAEEILEWRGIQKHSRLAYKGATTTKRFSDGYQTKHLAQVDQDLRLLQQCYLRGQHSLLVKGRPRHILIDGPYLHVSTVKEKTLWNEEKLIGYFVSPGGWIATYGDLEIYFFAEVDRRVFQLNPQNQQHELRLALFLTERWRQQAKSGHYEEPIAMGDLLASSMIPLDRANTTRFARRIQNALDELHERNILGAPPVCLSEVDTNHREWFHEWLKSRWCLTPPSSLVEHYRQVPVLRPPTGRQKALPSPVESERVE
jgi:hypothetical protein